MSHTEVEMMSTSNLADLVQPITAEDPCGPDLESDALLLYDRVFPKRKRRVSGPVDPKDNKEEKTDWRAIENDCRAILTKSKCLRTATLLATTQFYQRQWQGLSEGLELICQLAEHYWDGVHPQLEIVEYNGELNPEGRINAIAMLVAEPKIISEINKLTLFFSDEFGQFSVESVLSEKQDPQSSNSTIDAAAADTDKAALEIKRRFIEASIASLAQLKSVFSTKLRESITTVLDETETPDGKLRKEYINKLNAKYKDNISDITDVKYAQDKEFFVNNVFNKYESFNCEKLMEKLGDITKILANVVDNEEAKKPVENIPGQPSKPDGISNVITSREDVNSSIDRLCKYFEDNEPSSPVPILLRRAQSLIDKDFIDIVKDLTPAGLTQAKIFLEADSEKKK